MSEDDRKAEENAKNIVDMIYSSPAFQEHQQRRAYERERNSVNFVPEDYFDLAIDSEFGERIREDRMFAIRMYAALNNNDWKKGDESIHFASFRSNAGYIASIRGKGEDYLEFYCENYSEDIPDGYVDDEIKSGFLKHGITYDSI